MVVSGNECSASWNPTSCRNDTQLLLENVPSNLPGITFLSGGQSDIDATAHLDAMNKIGGNPWKLSFSYGVLCNRLLSKLGAVSKIMSKPHKRPSATGLK